METNRTRGGFILLIIILAAVLYIGRLFSIQVLSDEYARKAVRQVIKTRSVIPPRGNIYNRYGDIYASNRPMFNMEVNYNKLYIPDTSILLKHLNLTQEEIDRKIKQAGSKEHRFKDYIFARYIDPETYGVLSEQLWNFSGVSFSVANKRHYNQPVGANILGYINEVNQREIDESVGGYKLGDLIGRTGIERSHDSTLRGVQGTRKVLTNNRGREVGEYANGRFNVEPIKGKDVMLGIDTKLQALGEELMQGKKGSIVAIDPNSGEILAFVSAPNYDPTMLTGKEFRENYNILKRDPHSPLFNRPLKAKYPPGSIMKVPLAIAALNEGIITPDTYYSCGGGFKRNRGKPGCRFHPTLKLEAALRVSCNSFFAGTYVDFLHHPKYKNHYEGYQTWVDYMNRLGVGTKLNLDIPYEALVTLPDTNYYDNIYKGKGRWRALTIISNSIGQGEILMTPAQMAHMTAIVANRGYYVKPHFVRAVRDRLDQPWRKLYYPKEYTEINRAHYEVVIQAMEKVVDGGTASRAFISDISVAGKTGTSQNPHGEDHAVFIGFAPVDRPRIAIAVLIENAGGGGSWAAPTASVMMEQYIRGEVKEKKWESQRIKNTSFIKSEKR